MCYGTGVTKAPRATLQSITLLSELQQAFIVAGIWINASASFHSTTQTLLTTMPRSVLGQSSDRSVQLLARSFGCGRPALGPTDDPSLFIRLWKALSLYESPIRSLPPSSHRSVYAGVDGLVAILEWY
jgi:hypothetical protein